MRMDEAGTVMLSSDQLQVQEQLKNKAMNLLLLVGHGTARHSQRFLSDFQLEKLRRGQIEFAEISVATEFFMKRAGSGWHIKSNIKEKKEVDTKRTLVWLVYHKYIFCGQVSRRN